MRPRMRLKSASGWWFAAGREIEEALLLLSDSAFRLFVWICLRAERSTGNLWTDPTQVARLLRRTSEQIFRDLDELARHEVGRLEGDRIQIQDRFWPYERLCADTDAARSTYVAAIQRAFLRPAYRQMKQSLEAISELNQFLLRLDRDESKQEELES